MPAYDYKCPECGFTDEVIHGMSESPEYECPDCHLVMKKVFATFNMKKGRERIKGFINDRQRRELEIKQELRESYGVEQVVPLASDGLKEVYNDVKAQGNFVRDQMQESTEKSNAKRLAKQKAWKKQAMKRAPKRSQELVERRAKEAQAKNTIRL